MRICLSSQTVFAPSLHLPLVQREFVRSLHNDPPQTVYHAWKFKHNEGRQKQLADGKIWGGLEAHCRVSQNS